MASQVPSVSEIIAMMDFLTEVSTLYEIVPESGFRLMASNAEAAFVGVGGESLEGRALHELVPTDYYQQHLEPLFTRAVSAQVSVRAQVPWPFDPAAAALNALLVPVLDRGHCTHVWVITRREQAAGDIERMAFDDVVTGVPNRRYFMDRLGQEIERARNNGATTAVLLLDCDDFKDINDRHGHPAGDEALRIFVARVRNCIRDSDVLARYGGDEFAVLIPNAEAKPVDEIATRILEALRAPLELEQRAHRLTASIGVVLAQRSHPDRDELMRLADRALYAAKAAGKASYSVAVTGEPP